VRLYAETPFGPHFIGTSRRRSCSTSARHRRGRGRLRAVPEAGATGTVFPRTGPGAPLRRGERDRPFAESPCRPDHGASDHDRLALALLRRARRTRRRPGGPSGAPPSRSIPSTRSTPAPFSKRPASIPRFSALGLVARRLMPGATLAKAGAPAGRPSSSPKGACAFPSTSLGRARKRSPSCVPARSPAKCRSWTTRRVRRTFTPITGRPWSTCCRGTSFAGSSSRAICRGPAPRRHRGGPGAAAREALKKSAGFRILSGPI